MKVYSILLLLLGSLAVFADATADPTPAIDHLLSTVENSKCVFIRNGSEHAGKEAAEHMRRKYNYYKKEIRTPEQFIEKCATKSELSGKAYQVKLPDGQKVPSGDWMKKRLEEYRKKLNGNNETRQNLHN